MSVRISVVARDLELWTRESNAEIARQTLRRRRGRAYDPAVVDAALHVGQAALRDAREDDGLWSLS